MTTRTSSSAPWRSVSSLTAILMLLFLLSAGQLSAQASKKKIPIKLFSIPNPRNTNPFNQADLEVVRRFRELHPEVELQSFSGISIAGQQMDTRILLAIAGGNAPDVMYVNFRMSDTYIRQSFLYPLDKFIKRDMSEKQLKYRVAAPVMPVLKRLGPQIKEHKAGEHIWCLPYGMAVRTLFYRKDLFREVGLDPEKPPTTWEEMYKYSKKLCDPSQRRYGIVLEGGEQAAWDWMAYLWSAGGEAVVQNDKGEWEAVFNTREATMALDYYLKLTAEKWTDADGKVQRGYSSRSSSEGTYGIWNEGRAGMKVGYMGEQSIANVDPSLVGLAPFPLGPTGLRGTEINCRMMGMFADIKGRRNSDGKWVTEEEVREAAWQYILFYDSYEAQKIRTKKLVDLGLGKLLSPKRLREFGYHDYLRYVPKGWEDVFNEALRTGKPEPYGKNCQKVFYYMTEPLDTAIQMARKEELPEDKEKRLAVLKGLLDEAVEKTNIQMIGRIAPEVQLKRNIVAGVVAIVIFAIFCYVLYRVWQIFTPKHALTAEKQGWQFKKYMAAYIILIPAVGSIILWVYFPMLMGSRIAFLDYRFVGGSEFTGLKNLADVLYSEDWWNSLWNTFRYMFYLLGIGFFLPLILAVLLQEVSHGKMVYRLIYYLPAVMSGMVVIYMWKLFFQGDSAGIMNQVINGVLGLFGMEIEPIRWLEDKTWAMLCCVIPSIWAGTGPGCLIYLAALKGIPDDIYEAADIDGASFMRKAMHITIPSMKALIIIQFIGAFIAAAQNSGMILIMTYGQANTEVAGLHIFKEAYTSLRFGTAISMSWMLGISLLGFTVLQLRKLSNMEFKANTQK